MEWASASELLILTRSYSAAVVDELVARPISSPVDGRTRMFTSWLNPDGPTSAVDASRGSTVRSRPTSATPDPEYSVPETAESTMKPFPNTEIFSDGRMVSVLLTMIESANVPRFSGTKRTQSVSTWKVSILSG